MARIAGVEIPDNKRIKIALTYLYGIGQSSAEEILQKLNFSPDIQAKDLSADDLGRLRSMIENEYTVEGELRKNVTSNIKRLREIKSYRGYRHLRGLPSRGQRTRTNARTKKGKKK